MHKYVASNEITSKCGHFNMHIEANREAIAERGVNRTFENRILVVDILDTW